MKKQDLKPGYELDKLVAEKVMGWTVYQGKYDEPGKPTRFDSEGVYCFLSGKCDDPRSWSPSEDMNHALKVLAKLVEKHPALEWELMNDWDMYDDTTPRWSCKLIDTKEELENWAFSKESPAHAICLAALRAVGVSV